MSIQGSHHALVQLRDATEKRMATPGLWFKLRDETNAVKMASCSAKALQA
jgi:hypothetical protein